MSFLPKLTHPLQVDFQLVVNGVDISKKLNNRLISLQLTDNAGEEADSLALMLSDNQGKLAVPNHKAEIQLSLGTKESGLIDKGKFFVDETSYDGPPWQIGIVARSAEFKPEFLQGRATRSFNRQTLGDIINAIAASNQLQAMISPNYAGRRLVQIHQTDETDYTFLGRLAKTFGAHLNVKGDKLYFVQHDGFNSQDEALPSATISIEEVSSYSYRSQDREAYSGVRAFWNKAAYANRQEIVVGDSKNLTTLKGSYASAEEAKAAAYAELGRIKRGQFSLTLNLNRPRLEIIAGQPLNVTGFKDVVDAQAWIIKTVEHGFDGGSPFVSKIEAEQQLDSQEIDAVEEAEESDE